ncbi:cytochrome c oxidase subunit IV [Pyrrhoderma noxium]|uniref:Cytochrome c oxidase subunit IV n=1 Tax=Pyrrhoderma noxium TaxID=2282107 RepID=A0A286UVH0_9AGAM|nr:cytochrome c oxidase subunit IV [Pyrrhoderma noxium]
MSAALQLARTRARVALSRRCMATAAVHPGAAASSSSAAIPLSNVEAQWEKLSPEEQLFVHQQLEQIQKKDWKTLSIDEKKAAYYVAFGPHGPRTPSTPAGETTRLVVGIVSSILIATGMYYAVRASAPPLPKTMSKEWQEAMNEKAKEQKMNPIHGITSESYSGKGFVQ